MVAALYRRYRPESFSELIGQSHVTDPLSTALRADRVNHAYLFSGPRGCGKTTSARILARCLNCAEGPTPDPCGVCDSCVELGRDGGGSLDVVEIDAASHGGVDDARDLRERATFAPSRDRYKVFIIDEAHMVTSGGFNALLKIVEEPPEHIKFIFATTEPEKVIGTIRSRTHHYPFRLIAPAPMLEYVQQLCAKEGVEVEPGVLPLVVRAGGGSGRDTLSLLDQLIAGSEGRVAYGHAVALLGFTHGELLDEIIEALSAADAPRLFASIDRVVQSGQDPRRFVEDLLERLRDLIVAHAASDPAAILHGVPEDELATLVEQAGGFGSAELSRAADIVAKALTDMAGATSPRLHLELMAARLLVPESGDPEVGTLARVERLEQRLDGGVPAAPAPAAAPTVAQAAAPARGPASASAPAPTPEPPADRDPSHRGGPGAPGPDGSSGSQKRQPAAGQASTDPAAPAAPQITAAEPVAFAQLRDAWDEVLQQLADQNRSAWMVAATITPKELRPGDVLVLSFQSEADVQRFRESQAGKPSIADLLRTAIRSLLGIEVKYIARAEPSARGAREQAAASDAAELPAASAPAPIAPPAQRAPTTQPVAASAPTPTPAPAATATPAPATPRPAPTASQPTAAARQSTPARGAKAAAASAPAARQGTTEPAAATAVTGWAVAVIPTDAEAPPEDLPEQALPDQPEPDPFSFVSAPDAPEGTPLAPEVEAAPAAPSPMRTARASEPVAPEPVLSASQAARYGESVVREELGAELIEERPRVRGER
ncbi:DNA polymerase III subunit gamma and tau [Agrococcus jenensis]|uniref:DNA polymerase III subunit gamma/tau n=1 Tax=Agrococcus jenensis TaxID=46353 RepID=A0A3N2AQ26_9MICO|nr:DNA polymerase III subunit gamma and tau [Agrococcus jenensis]ROR65018.1 DNA polymerase-3 subunit gamma/tau [Agrococcus jenensis]